MNFKGVLTMVNRNFPEKGIIYCATGKKVFFNEVKVSVKYLREFNKEINVTIFTDKKDFIKNDMDLFDSVYEITSPEYSFGDKIFAIKNTPYQKTIFLDTDTIVNDDITELYCILDIYDVAATNTPFKNSNYSPFYFNTGVFAYNLNSKTRKFFELWDKEYHKGKYHSDQPTFRNALYTTSIFIFTLPPEYNFRLPFPSYALRKIKIFHDHKIIKLEKYKRKILLEKINKNHEERVWFPNQGIITFRDNKNILTDLLIFLESFITTKIKLQFLKRFYPKMKFKKKLVQYNFPWLINWAMPKDYRKRVKLAHKKINELANE